MSVDSNWSDGATFQKGKLLLIDVFRSTANTIIPITDEPVKIVPMVDSLFLVATKDGKIMVFQLQPKCKLIHIFQTQNNTIHDLKYQLSTDHIITIENTSPQSQIKVVRVYMNWRKRGDEDYSSGSDFDNSPPSSNASHSSSPGVFEVFPKAPPVNKGEHREKQKLADSFESSHMQVIAIELPNSVQNVDVCGQSNHLCITTSASLSLWRIHSNAVRMILEIQQGGIRDVVIFGTTLSFSTGNELFVIQVVQKLATPLEGSENTTPKLAIQAVQQDIDEWQKRKSISSPPQSLLFASTTNPSTANRSPQYSQQYYSVAQPFIQNMSARIAKLGKPMFHGLKVSDDDDEFVIQPHTIGNKLSLLGLSIPSLANQPVNPNEVIPSSVTIGPLKCFHIVKQRSDAEESTDVVLLLHQKFKPGSHIVGISLIPEYDFVNNESTETDSPVLPQSRHKKKKNSELKLFVSTNQSGFLYSLRDTPYLLTTYHYVEEVKSVYCSDIFVYVATNEQLYISPIRPVDSCTLSSNPPTWIGVASNHGLVQIIEIDSYVIMLQKETEKDFQRRIEQKQWKLTRSKKLEINSKTPTKGVSPKKEKGEETVGWKLSTLSLNSLDHLIAEIRTKANDYKETKNDFKVAFDFLLESHYIIYNYLCSPKRLRNSSSYNQFNEIDLDGTSLPVQMQKEIRKSFEALGSILLEMKEYQLCCHCYSQSLNSPTDFPSRFNILKGSIPEQHHRLIVFYFLNKILFATNGGPYDVSGRYLSRNQFLTFDRELEASVLTLYSDFYPNYVPSLIFCLKLKEYNNAIIAIINDSKESPQLSRKEISEMEIALVIVYLKNGNKDEAVKTLQSVSEPMLVQFCIEKNYFLQCILGENFDSLESIPTVTVSPTLNNTGGANTSQESSQLDSTTSSSTTATTTASTTLSVVSSTPTTNDTSSSSSSNSSSTIAVPAYNNIEFVTSLIETCPWGFLEILSRLINYIRSIGQSNYSDRNSCSLIHRLCAAAFKILLQTTSERKEQRPDTNGAKRRFSNAHGGVPKTSNSATSGNYQTPSNADNPLVANSQLLFQLRLVTMCFCEYYLLEMHQPSLANPSTSHPASFDNATNKFFNSAEAHLYILELLSQYIECYQNENFSGMLFAYLDDRDEEDTETKFEVIWKRFHSTALLSKRKTFFDTLLPPAFALQRSLKDERLLSKMETNRLFYIKKIHSLFSFIEIESEELSDCCISLLKAANFEPSLFQLFECLCSPKLKRLELGIEYIIKQEKYDVLHDFVVAYATEMQEYTLVSNMFLSIFRNGGNSNSLLRQYELVLNHFASLMKPESFLSLIPDNGNIEFFLPFIHRAMLLHQSSFIKSSISLEVHKFSTEC